MENPIKSVIEIHVSVPFDLSPSDQVIIGLKRLYISLNCIQNVYDFQKMYLGHNPWHKLFDLILADDAFAAVSLIRLC